MGDRAVLGMLRARPFALAEDPLLRSTVDRLAAQLDVEPPKLQLIADTFPRAFVVGRGPRSATVVVSAGLLTALPSDEIEAVLAHELAHVRSRDVLTQTSAVLISTTLLELARIGGFLAGTLLTILAPIAAAFTHALLSPKRELAADAAAARLVDPDDLADALVRLDRAAELVEFTAAPTTEPLYTVTPFDHWIGSRACSKRIRRSRSASHVSGRSVPLALTRKWSGRPSRPEAGFAGREARRARS